VCTICIEQLQKTEYEDIVVTQCGHAFHKTCIEAWLRKSSPPYPQVKKIVAGECPVCQAEVRMVGCIKMYLNTEEVDVVDPRDVVIAKREANDRKMQVNDLQKRVYQLEMDLQIEERKRKLEEIRCSNMSDELKILKSQLDPHVVLTRTNVSTPTIPAVRTQTSFRLMKKPEVQNNPVTNTRTSMSRMSTVYRKASLQAAELRLNQSNRTTAATSLGLATRVQRSASARVVGSNSYGSKPKTQDNRLSDFQTPHRPVTRSQTKTSTAPMKADAQPNPRKLIC